MALEEVDDERLAVRVTDRGVGISPDELKRIFRRFYRIPASVAVRAKGSGLGLFIVRSVAKKHGGRAFAESLGAGQGSTFTLLLPKAPASSDVQRVLIVEDEQHLAEGLRFNLEAEGFEAEVVDTGEGALERLLGRAGPRFDLVVLDVMLPGKDGFAVVSELRAAKQFVPVLMLTARGRPEDVLKGFAAGADDYLPKPTELAILLARIGGLLRRSGWLRQAQDLYTFAGKTIDFDTLELRVGDREAAAHADGSEPAALSDRARRQGRVAQGHARGRLGRARGHRHARDRQLHRAAAPLHREGAGPPEAPADRARRRVPVRRRTGRIRS